MMISWSEILPFCELVGRYYQNVQMANWLVDHLLMAFFRDVHCRVVGFSKIEFFHNNPVQDQNKLEQWRSKLSQVWSTIYQMTFTSFESFQIPLMMSPEIVTNFPLPYILSYLNSPSKIYPLDSLSFPRPSLVSVTRLPDLDGAYLNNRPSIRRAHRSLCSWRTLPAWWDYRCRPCRAHGTSPDTTPPSRPAWTHCSTVCHGHAFYCPSTRPNSSRRPGSRICPFHSSCHSSYTPRTCFPPRTPRSHIRTRRRLSFRTRWLRRWWNCISGLGLWGGVAYWTTGVRGSTRRAAAQGLRLTGDARAICARRGQRAGEGAREATASGCPASGGTRRRCLAGRLWAMGVPSCLLRWSGSCCCCCASTTERLNSSPPDYYQSQPHSLHAILFQSLFPIYDPFGSGKVDQFEHRRCLGVDDSKSVVDIKLVELLFFISNRSSTTFIMLCWSRNPRWRSVE